MRAAIPPSLSARSRLETHFRKNSLIVNGPDLFRVDSLLIIFELSSGTSAVISCASVNERIHSSSSNNFVVGSFFFLQEHQLRVEEESAVFW